MRKDSHVGAVDAAKPSQFSMQPQLQQTAAVGSFWNIFRRLGTSNKFDRILKKSINAFLSLAGLKLIRIQAAPHAFVDPALRSVSTKEHNSRDNMDTLYADPNLMTHYFTTERLAFYEQVARLLGSLELAPVTVLDVGCGAGHLLGAMRRLYPLARLRGMDFAPNAVRVARQLFPNLDFEIGSVFELDELGDRFDLVLCTEVLEHLEDADLAIEKLLSACRPNGNLAITVPQGRHDTFSGHFNFWTPESFRREFRYLNPDIQAFDRYLFIHIRRS